MKVEDARVMELIKALAKSNLPPALIAESIYVLGYLSSVRNDQSKEPDQPFFTSGLA